MPSHIPTHLIIEKILHDIANPLGNTHNFISLLDNETDRKSDHQGIIELALKSSSDLLNVFQHIRFVFGPSETTTSLTFAELIEHLQHYLSKRKITFEIDKTLKLVTKKNLFPVIIAVADIASEFLPFGGSLNLTKTPNSELEISCTGKHISDNPILISALTSPHQGLQKDLKHNTILGYHAGHLIEQLGLVCRVNQTSDRISILLSKE